MRQWAGYLRHACKLQSCCRTSQGHYNRKMLHYISSSPLLALHVLYMYLFLANLLDCVW